MDRGKIKHLSELARIVKDAKKSGRTVGLITGCFDLVHINHVAWFSNSKKKVDILIVGIENDKTIKQSKGNNRPINDQTRRLLFLTSISSINYVFLIRPIYSFESEVAEKHHMKIRLSLSPTYLISNKEKDKYWNLKEKNLKNTDIKILNIIGYKEEISTTLIEEKLLAEK